MDVPALWEQDGTMKKSLIIFSPGPFFVCLLPFFFFLFFRTFYYYAQIYTVSHEKHLKQRCSLSVVMVVNPFHSLCLDFSYDLWTLVFGSSATCHSSSSHLTLDLHLKEGTVQTKYSKTPFIQRSCSFISSFCCFVI